MQPRDRWERTIPFGADGVDYRISLNRLNLKPQDFVGKRVLDIGSGVKLPLASWVYADTGVNIVSLEPRASYNDIVGLRTPFVSGEAAALPFKDNTFDLVVSQYSVPMWLDQTREELVKSFNEIDRVLVAGGEARLYPPHNNIFWYEYKDHPYSFPPEVERDSQGAKMAFIALRGLRGLGIPNLSLERRKVVNPEEEFVYQPSLLVYKKAA